MNLIKLAPTIVDKLNKITIFLTKFSLIEVNKLILNW